MQSSGINSGWRCSPGLEHTASLHEALHATPHQSKQTPTLLLPWNRERRHTEGLYSSLPSHVCLNSEVAMALTNLTVPPIFHCPMVMFFEWPQILNLFHTNMAPHITLSPPSVIPGTCSVLLGLSPSHSPFSYVCPLFTFLLKMLLLQDV